MNKIREIIRLKEHCSLSERAISRALGVSRPVVSSYLQVFDSAGLDYHAIQQIDDETLAEIVTGDNASRPPRYDHLHKHFEHYLKELRRPGVTLFRLWQEYKDEQPQGYGYSQFCYYFQLWRSTSELTMHVDHKAGDKMFVDFTGKKLEIVNRTTGLISEVEVFVSVLAASQLTYVEALASQKKHDWIMANQNAFHYFGGITKAIVPDNLKSAVRTPSRYEPDINPEYADFARHYQTVILPARPGRPRDKALVEGAVRIVYAWIFAALRNRIFYSLKELNQAIVEQLDRYNNKPMQKLKLSRRQLFDQTEKALLKPLPRERYAIKKFNEVKVQFNYHVFLSEDKHYYSVPYRFRAKHVMIIYTNSVVEIFHNHKRLAMHKRNRSPNGYTTIKEHMPSHHQFMSQWSPERFIRWAEKMGPPVKTVIEHILANRRHPEQAFKTCLGILNLEKKFDKDRLNKACQRAIEFHNYSYKGINNILENRLEDYQIDCFAALPNHKNIRGNQYYQSDK